MEIAHQVKKSCRACRKKFAVYGREQIVIVTILQSAPGQYWPLVLSYLASSGVLLPDSHTIHTKMVQSCGPEFEKHRQIVIERTVGGGIVCSLEESALRIFLDDINIRLRAQQDIIIGALDELKRRTDSALAAIGESGSPFTFAVLRALKSHHIAYITFTKVWRKSPLTK